MATVNLEVKGLSEAIRDMEGQVEDFLKKADRKFKVAGTRIEAYAKAASPVDTGFHRRNIRHNPRAGFLVAEVVAAAEYASVLEFGFTGVVNVSGHTRTRGDTTYNVSPHTRQMARPARPHIVPAAQRALKQLIDDLQAL